MTIEELIKKTTRLEYELESVKQELRKQEIKREVKFERVKEGEIYYSIYFEYFDKNKGLVIARDEEQDHPMDKVAFDNNNYFKTEQRAQEVADKINFLLKLERLHDIYCLNYVPDWNSGNWKYSVFYHHTVERYTVEGAATFEDKTKVYFPTEEIAQKVCDILNAEQEKEEIEHE